MMLVRERIVVSLSRAVVSRATNVEKQLEVVGKTHASLQHVQVNCVFTSPPLVALNNVFALKFTQLFKENPIVVMDKLIRIIYFFF